LSGAVESDGLLKILDVQDMLEAEVDYADKTVWESELDGEDSSDENHDTEITNRDIS
jgi:hypothetical protein